MFAGPVPLSKVQLRLHVPADCGGGDELACAEQISPGGRWSARFPLRMWSIRGDGSQTDTFTREVSYVDGAGPGQSSWPWTVRTLLTTRARVSDCASTRACPSGLASLDPKRSEAGGGQEWERGSSRNVNAVLGDLPMLSRCLLLTLGLVIGLASACATQGTPPERKIYIVTDLEGASGVYKFAQTREPGNSLEREAKAYLMDDIAAVVRGLRAGGATEIVVLDGHGSQAFVPHLMEPGAEYITGKPRRDVLWGLDDSFAGLVLLGHHAMMGTPDGVLHHTQSSRAESRYWYNDVESGELAQVAAIAGHFDVPPILVTGDEATCREACTFFGSSCVTVAVKRGISREAAVLYPFTETRAALFEGARRAMAKLPQCRPYRIATPIKAKKQFLKIDENGVPSQPVIKEGTITDVRHLLDF